jgi:hypothetical protein
MPKDLGYVDFFYFLLYIDLFILPVKVKENFLAVYGKFAVSQAV